MCAKFGRGRTVVSKKRGVQTDTQTKGHYSFIILVEYTGEYIIHVQHRACILFICWNNEILHIFLYRNMPEANNDVIYVVVEFDNELGVNSSTMEVMPDNWRDHVGNLCVLYPYH